MKKLSQIYVLILCIFFLVLIGCKKDSSQADKKQRKQFVTIGTGGVTGVYYPTGGAISKMINQKEEYNIKATVESTGGSVYNINAVLSGDLDFGIAQSDRQYQAYHGMAEWNEKGKQSTLRAVFALHPESITLVATDSSNINGIKDLAGKRVNLGNAGSGQLQNSKDVLNAYNLSEADLQAEFVKAVEAPGLMQDERIDAFFFTVGHPNGTIKESTSGRIKVKVVSISGPEIDALIKKLPYYAPSTIPRIYYPNSTNYEDTTTVGVKATLVSSTAVSEEVVYAVTKEVFENLVEFKKLHPAFEVLTQKNMLQGLSAPIHKGALKYFKERGLDQYLNKDLIID